MAEIKRKATVVLCVEPESSASVVQSVPVPVQYKAWNC